MKDLLGCFFFSSLCLGIFFSRTVIFWTGIREGFFSHALSRGFKGHFLQIKVLSVPIVIYFQWCFSQGLAVLWTWICPKKLFVFLMIFIQGLGVMHCFSQILSVPEVTEFSRIGISQFPSFSSFLDNFL